MPLSLAADTCFEQLPVLLGKVLATQAQAREKSCSFSRSRANVRGSGSGGCGQMQKCLVIYDATSEFKYERLHIEGCTAPEKRLCV